MASFVDLGPVDSVTGLNSTAEVIGDAVGSTGKLLGYFRDAVGVMHTINPLLGDDYSNAVAVNDSGQVAGNSISGGGILNPDEAVLYSQGNLTDLGTLGGQGATGPYSTATAISSSGQVVGYSPGSTGLDAFLWTQTKGMQDLTDLGFKGEPTDINSSGQIIGVTVSAAPQSILLERNWERGLLADIGWLGHASECDQQFGSCRWLLDDKHEHPHSSARVPVEPGTADA